ncbi:hypothetical protein [Subtercola endophyticus]|uniref:hypothetical protein n=1 Tax=Subtercola endophyticus TaxID=2895559 RepID=UPI001E5ED9E6|nr:hypothetical protein [Subtercola endophyticus]UFS58596.1 hypothetical protein LQ955_16590 [Subtercola endophyticus]
MVGVFLAAGVAVLLTVFSRSAQNDGFPGPRSPGTEVLEIPAVSLFDGNNA